MTRVFEVWTPCTDSTVPQPAGKQCADWYERVRPDAEDMLYALAHTKGQRDELLAALQKSKQYIEQLCSTVNTLSNHAGLGDKVRVTDFSEVANSIISKATQS